MSDAALVWFAVASFAYGALMGAGVAILVMAYRVERMLS